MMRLILLTLALIAIGAGGGWVASHFPVPLPWMLGSLLTVGIAAGVLHNGPLRDYAFPGTFRSYFVGLIGVMIGSQVSPELLGQLKALPLTVPGLLLFVLAAHGMNYVLFHRFGGMDRATAFYSGAPGGLIESLLMGEAAGAKVSVLTMMQFLRIISVITLVPVGLSIWVGHPVGSAAGDALAATAPAEWLDIALICIVAAVGLWVAQFLHLPAAQLVGPLLLSGGLSLAGIMDTEVPGWLIAGAQVVVGTSLGLRFKGISPGMIGQALRLSILSVCGMLILGFGLAMGLSSLTQIDPLHLLISFAPGGVTEMSIIALSLDANPALVSTHHVIRILMTVAIMGWLARRLGLSG